MKKDNILVFVRYYLPGYKAGGPVVSISEFIKKLNKYANFYVITSDRDFLDNNSYKNIKVNKWNSKFNVLINYVSNNYFDYIKVLLITLKKKKYNTYYFSSLFDFKFTILPILFSKILFIRNKRIIIAPRGELYPGALKLKRNKKLFFLRFVKIINLFSNVVWHATSEDEKKVIRNIFPKSTILISLNFYETLNTKIKLSKSNHIDDKIRIIYYSRITPKKNLKYCIEILSQVSVKFKMDIYGPIDDVIYWEDCKKLINKFDLINKIEYCGTIKRSRIVQTLTNYDLFILPTFGENFGHVIFDAINCGLPVLLSNNTPWKNIHNYSIGWSIPLQEKNNYIKIINEFESWKKINKKDYHKNSKKFLMENFNINNVIISYRNLFNI